MKRDHTMIDQLVLPLLDHDTAAHIQQREMTPDVIHAPHAFDHLPVFHRQRIRKRPVAQVNAKHHFPVARRAVFEIDVDIAVENAVVFFLGVSVPGQDLSQNVVDLHAVLLRGVLEAAAFQGDGGSRYLVPVRGMPGIVAGGITGEARYQQCNRCRLRERGICYIGFPIPE